MYIIKRKIAGRRRRAAGGARREGEKSPARVKPASKSCRALVSTEARQRGRPPKPVTSVVWRDAQAPYLQAVRSM